MNLIIQALLLLLLKLGPVVQQYYRCQNKVKTYGEANDFSSFVRRRKGKTEL